MLQNPRIQLEHPEREVEAVLEGQIDEIVAMHMRCCWAVANKGDFREAYNCQSALVQNFNKLLSSQKARSEATKQILIFRSLSKGDYIFYVIIHFLCVFCRMTTGLCP